MKIEKLQIKQPIIYIDGPNKTFCKGHVCSISVRTIECKEPFEAWEVYAEIERNNKIEKQQLFPQGYKDSHCADWCCSGWCFPDSKKYLNYVKNFWESRKSENQKPKTRDPKWDKYPHDNNAKQREAMLAPQRELVGKIIQQGYIWQRYWIQKRGSNQMIERWGMVKNPQITFSKNDFYVEIPNFGSVRIRKFGNDFRLKCPEEEGKTNDTRAV